MSAERAAADDLYAELLTRSGEGAPRAGLAPTRRALDLLGDPQRAVPVIAVTGTNGKTSTARLIEGLLRAHGLRTGLFTSPHLRRFTERIVLDGEPISDEAVVSMWRDIEPVVGLVDAELQAAGGARLTFFESLTVLAYAAFADAPVDVAVVEVGMGGEWDSTNVADAAVAVFGPIDLDHTDRLGRTISEIARTKSGILKPAARAVSAAQRPEAAAVLADAAEKTESPLAVAGADFALESRATAVGGQLVTIRGLAGTYADLPLPLLGAHQGENAALAVAAVEAFLGGGSQAIAPDVVADGLAAVRSPGRLEVAASEPTILVDAAHNPHGAAALAAGVADVFGFEELAVVVAVLADKDADGILAALAGVATRCYVTEVDSDRAVPAADLAAVAAAHFDPESALFELDHAEDAISNARDWAAAAAGRGVLVTGSVVLVGEALDVIEDRGWRE